MSARGSPKLSRTVAALAQAALALPGVAAAAELQTDYLFSWYREAELPAASNASGQDSERYDIQSHVFSLVAPLDEQQLGARLTLERMSGASPWWVQPASPTDPRPVQVMSGASIREDRVAADASYRLPLPRGAATVVAGISDEDDYRSVSGGLEVAVPNASESVTWSAGARYSDDHLEPTQAVGQSRIASADKRVASVYGSVGVVLDRRNLFQAGLSYQHQAGHLSDPYKLVFVTGTGSTVSDQRPEGREGLAGTLKLRRHLPGPDAALHLDYRYYRDDWEIDSHTFEAAWHQRVTADWRVIPALRWYSQSQAFFYAPYFSAIPADSYRSSDYRLSPFGAISARLDVVKSLGALGLGGGLEYYEASGRHALGEVAIENPGLVEYLGAHLRISYRF